MSLGVFRSFAPALLAQSQLSCKCSILNIMGDAAEQQSYMEDGTQPYPDDEEMERHIHMNYIQMNPAISICMRPPDEPLQTPDILEVFVEEEAFPPPPPPHLQI